jgi:UDP-N-acetylglucosamine diphosphorylase/glucosamine-1-phosphate N-acetyltransferase
MDLGIIIMAGGLGKRMQSDLPKVLHLVDNQPMIVRVITQALLLNPIKIIVVVGKFRQIIETTINKYISIKDDSIIYVDQPIPMGTGHAITCCIPYLENISNSSEILILSGDVPLLQANTIKSFYDSLIISNTPCGIMTTSYKNPFGYGRIIKDNDGHFIKIVEEKDCNDEQKLIQETNCGTYIIQNKHLLKYLPKLTCNNAQNEYYLTDIIGLVHEFENVSILTYNIPAELQYQLSGVNTKAQLDELNSIYSQIYNK